MPDLYPSNSNAFSFFEQPEAAATASAPGRVDVMGGISDYAGGLVLEGTIAERARVTVALRADRRFRVCSIGLEAPERSWAEWPVEAISPAGRTGVPRLAAILVSQPALRWSAYAAGVFTSLAHHHPGARVLDSGWDVMLDSAVPSGAGVSSSAALEVATLAATLAALRKQGRSLEIDGLEAARICQWAENHVAGAPCGIMDQVTSALGQPDRLLALLCQPCELKGFFALPPGVEISCINSNVKHSVGGSRYITARVGAFMGLQILRQAASDLRLLNYLCELDAGEFLKRWQRELPAVITGREYLDRYHHYPDPVTTVAPDGRYSVRACTGHPILERRRTERFLDGLRRAADSAEPDDRERSLRFAGEQMYASNWSYTSRVGLGSKETGTIVRIARECGSAAGVYGARVTGGGCGGTVAVLHRSGQRSVIERIRSRSEDRLGIAIGVLHGSSAGAWMGQGEV